MRFMYRLLPGTLLLGLVVWLIAKPEGEPCIEYGMIGTGTREWTVRAILGETRGRLDVGTDGSYLLDTTTGELLVLFHQLGVFWRLKDASLEETLDTPAELELLARGRKISAAKMLHQSVARGRDDTIWWFEIGQAGYGTHRKVTVTTPGECAPAGEGELLRRLVVAAAAMGVLDSWIVETSAWVCGIPARIEVEKTYAWDTTGDSTEELLAVRAATCPRQRGDAYRPPASYKEAPVDLSAIFAIEGLGGG